VKSQSYLNSFSLSFDL